MHCTRIFYLSYKQFFYAQYLQSKNYFVPIHIQWQSFVEDEFMIITSFLCIEKVLLLILPYFIFFRYIYIHIFILVDNHFKIYVIMIFLVPLHWYIFHWTFHSFQFRIVNNWMLIISCTYVSILYSLAKTWVDCKIRCCFISC